MVDRIIKEIRENEIYDWLNQCRNQKVYIFGAGSLASTVAKVLKAENIEILGFIVDKDYYSEGMRIKGINVYNWEKITFSDPSVIVLGMSDMRRGREIEQTPNIINVVYPSDIAFEENLKITLEYIENNRECIDNLFGKLADKKSKDVLESWLVSCARKYEPRIFDYCEEKSGYFANGIIDMNNIKAYINVGAYIGDTIDDFLKYVRNYNIICGVEGDVNLASFLREKYANNKKIEIIEKVFWNEEKEVEFKLLEKVNSVGRTVIDNSSEKSGVVTETFDKYVDGNWKTNPNIDLITISFRGEENVISGAIGTIRKMRPNVVVKVGFEKDLLNRIIEILDSTDLDYKYYLRFRDCRAGELTLYAV